jgi:plasmid stability protein
MKNVPTLHVRNVPAEVYERLRARAKRAGRSINAEVVVIRSDVVEDEGREEDVFDELERLSFDLPEGAPTPERLIREARDAGG